MQLFLHLLLFLGLGLQELLLFLPLSFQESILFLPLSVQELVSKSEFGSLELGQLGLLLGPIILMADSFFGKVAVPILRLQLRPGIFGPLRRSASLAVFGHGDGDSDYLLE